MTALGLEAPREVELWSLRRVRRRLARFFAGGAVFFAVAPVALLLVNGLLSHLVAAGELLLDVTLWFWLAAWLGGAPLCFVLSLGATRGTRLRAGALRSLEARLRAAASTSPLAPVRLRTPLGSLEVSPGALEGALLVAGEDSVVELVLPGGDVLLAAPRDDAAAKELLAALGFGPGRRRTRVHLGGSGAPLGAGCSGLFVGILVSVLTTCGVAGLASSWTLMDAVGPYLIGVTFVLASVLAGKAFTPGTVLVGVDGILLDKPFRRRFIPAAEGLRVFRRRGALHLAFREGEGESTLELMHDTEARTAAVQARLEEAFASAAAAAESPEEELSRRGRPIAGWREALSRLGGVRGYRGRTLPVETLLALVEDQGQSPEQRIGAALVVGQGEDAEAKARVRLVAESLANERLSRALLAASDGGADEEALREALAEEEQAEALAPPRRL